MPNGETGIFAIQTFQDEKELIIYDETSKKIINRLECDSKVINCYFVRSWFLVMEQNKIVAYDQKKNFQRLVFFSFVDFSLSKMIFVDGSFFFAFVNKSNYEVNLLTFKNNFDDSSFKPFAKQKVAIVSFSDNAKLLACVSEDNKELKLYESSKTKMELSHFFLSGKQIVDFWVINEEIFLFYYKDNSFSVIDFKKKVKSYFIFESFFEIRFKPDRHLCSYELSHNIKPIVFPEIDYYDKKTKSIRAVDFVG